MKILCATDFSAPAERAVRIAAKLARRLGDSLTVLHVLEPWVGYPLDFQVPASVIDQLRKAASARLAKSAAAVRDLGVPIELEMLEGIADATVIERAKELGARLIVTGSHGRRGVQRWVLGSTAERTAEHADRPVLVVRENADALEAWLDSGRPLRAMVALDESRAGDATLAWLRGIRPLLPIDVTFVHLYWPPEQYQRLGLHGPRDLFSTDPDVQQVLQRDLWTRIGELPGTGEVHLITKPSWGNRGAALSLTGHEGFDLLVSGTHQRGPLSRVVHPSVSRELLHATDLPVMFVPQSLAVVAHHVPELTHVLAATDFSEAGDQAVREAFAVLGDRPGIVEILHVAESGVPVPAYSESGAALSDEARKKIEARLHSIIPDDARRDGVTVRIDVVAAPRAGEVIVQTAERVGADLICVGTRGRSQAGKLLLGSVAGEVLTRAARPVLVVRRHPD